jgi:NADH dehydrogenase FAD-containing subunit
LSRLLEAGEARILKKISFQDSSNLPKDLTHVFVETKLKADVQHLESKGISVYSPDYIPEYILKVWETVG